MAKILKITEHERPRLDEAIDISEIAASLKLDLKKYPQKNGFLVHPRDARWYRERIKTGRNIEADYFSVARNGEQVLGYVMGCLKSLLPLYVEKGLITCPETAKYLERKAGYFFFGEQIGVNPRFAKRGVGRKLLEGMVAWAKAYDADRVIVDILHEPTRNEASITFCEQFGFKQADEIENSDHTTWGLYELDLRNMEKK